LPARATNSYFLSIRARTRGQHRSGDARDRAGNSVGRLRFSRLSGQAATDRTASVHAVRAMAAEKSNAQMGDRRLRHLTALGLVGDGQPRTQGAGVLRVRDERPFYRILRRCLHRMVTFYRSFHEVHHGFSKVTPVSADAASSGQANDGAAKSGGRIVGDPQRVGAGVMSKLVIASKTKQSRAARDALDTFVALRIPAVSVQHAALEFRQRRIVRRLFSVRAINLIQSRSDDLVANDDLIILLSTI
jgi:hypothetical protein